MKYKILCTDGFSKVGLDEFKKVSFLEVTSIDKLSHEELVKKIADFDGLVVRSSSEVSRDVIEAGKNLKIVARAGVGTDNIDIDAATERGILVVNAPAGNSISTAELTFAMILAMSRHIPQASKAMGDGKWEKKKFRGNEIAFKTLGIIGLGRIGREVARRALSFKMKVLGFDPFLSKERFESLGVTKASLEEIYTTSDFITVHTPLSPETENLISAEELKKMKRNCRIVNCARGGIINEDDLAVALREGWIAGAALDVFSEEPFKGDIFKGLDNVILTPHLGASTSEAQDAVAREAASAIGQFFIEGLSPSAVNLPSGAQDLQQFRSHIMLAEKLGSLVAQLGHGEIKRITFSATLSLPHILTLSAIKGVLSHSISDTVTLVNASNKARERGLGISEEIVSDMQDFAGAIGVKVHVNGNELAAWGAILPDGTAKIVSCVDYRVEIDPTGSMLFIQNYDQPGVIGRVSTLLGDHGVNIAEMQNVRKNKGSDALTVIRVDGDVPKETFENINNDPGVKRARLVHL
jgi:D-3-phosphoglycerate dehydrogenase